MRGRFFAEVRSRIFCHTAIVPAAVRRQAASSGGVYRLSGAPLSSELGSLMCQHDRGGTMTAAEILLVSVIELAQSGVQSREPR
jgi:hypothetical protein